MNSIFSIKKMILAFNSLSTVNDGERIILPVFIYPPPPTTQVGFDPRLILSGV